MTLHTMGKGRALAGLMLGLALSQNGGAQQSVPGSGPAAELKPNPMTALRDFEGPDKDDYELGRGDEISIDFGGRPELNSKRIVGPDGRISIAPAGSIVVADKTREQAAQAIAAAMSTYYSWLSVTVGVDKYTSNRVLLLGAVDHPGIIRFDQRPTLLEVLTQGGGMRRAERREQRRLDHRTGAYGAGYAGALRDLSRHRQGDVGRPERAAR